MKISQVGIDLIKSFEGLKLEAYQDSVNVWTIGYGTTKNVQPGMKITLEQAEELLRHDLDTFERGVTSLIGVPVSQNQFDALVSFAYNLGLGSLKKSTLLKYLNNAQYLEAADEFLRWDKAGGKKLKGLTKRRNAERLLFLKNRPIKELLEEAEKLAIARPPEKILPS